MRPYGYDSKYWDHDKFNTYLSANNAKFSTECKCCIHFLNGSKKACRYNTKFNDGFDDGIFRFDCHTLTEFTPAIIEEQEARGGCGNPPTNDHVELFKCADGSRLYTWQPYWRWRFSEQRERIEEIKEFAHRNNLEFDWSGVESWYYPGETVLMVLRKKIGRG